jgi:hypothetical protein
MKPFYCVTILLALSFSVQAQKWNIETPNTPSKKVTITTDEGTWMDLDVSPDGKSIAFDLLGDIYTVPMVN